MRKLPCMYWLPKLHKNPFGSRFIAGSKKCTTKPLSNLLKAYLTTITIHFKEYCVGIFKNTGINCYWIIYISQQVLDYLSILNRVSKAKHFDSFDFSTSYTNIHNALKSNLVDLVDEAFRVGGANYLATSKLTAEAYWTMCSKDNEY